MVPRVPVKVLLDCQLDGVLFEVFLQYCSVPPDPLLLKVTVVVTEALRKLEFVEAVVALSFELTEPTMGVVVGSLVVMIHLPYLL